MLFFFSWIAIADIKMYYNILYQDSQSTFYLAK